MFYQQQLESTSKLNINSLNPTNNYDLFYGMCKCPESVINEVDKSIKDIFSNKEKYFKMNNDLAGHIEEEYRLSKTPFIEKFVKDQVLEIENKTNHAKSIIENFANYFANIHPNTKVEWYMHEKPWVNIQYKGEFNPPHVHAGLYSWVIWHDIPYTKEEEIKSGPGRFKEHGHVNGDFQFSTSDYKSSSIINHNLQIDKSANGTFIIFPSNLNHTVFPFFSTDKPRITVAGNIHLRIIEENIKDQIHNFNK